ncbi:MAG: TrbI/VirB10 family protein [Terriglobales bacterium]
MNGNGFKTSVVAPESAAVASEPAAETLTTRALEDIRDTERLSGFGRFATKMQSVFQSSKPSRSKRQSSHLKAAPIMMSAGLLLLVATALLFLLSKPESSVHSHFRQPTGLSGTDDRKGSSTAANSDSNVTENQLVGGEGNSDTQEAGRTKTAASVRQDSATRRFSYGDDGPANGAASTQPNVATTSELQTPATVFVGNSVSQSVSSPIGISSVSVHIETQLPSGTEIVAHTTNAISSGLESPVIAVVDRNIQLGNQVVIPQGSRVIGYTAGAVKDRVNVRFTSLVLPNSRREITISGLALMRDGSAGLVGKVQGSGHPILAGAGRVATGASALALQFAGQNNQPFSQSDYLRNQLASEVASEGSRYSNRLQQSISVPIVTVNTNESIRIFLLNALSVSGGQVNPRPIQQTDSATITAEQNQTPDQALAATQAAYIQALEAQLADMRTALNARNANGRH